jgi:hypothetical protein
MKFSQLKGQSIVSAFEQFDQQNPDVYKMFVAYAKNWINTGARCISSKQIIGRIRWFHTVESYNGTDFKVNDAFTAHYARKFIGDYPQYKDKFELRELRAL